MDRRTIISVVIVLAIIGGFGAYRFMPRNEVRSFTLIAMDYGYNGIRGGPAIAVNVGDTVEVTLINKGKVTHEFIVISRDTLRKVVKAEDFERDEFEEVIGEPLTPVFEGAAILGLEPGETKTIRFVPDQPGMYVYACFEDEPRGRLHIYNQMWGEFTVVPRP